MSDALNTWIAENAKKLIVAAFAAGVGLVPALKLIGYIF